MTTTLSGPKSKIPVIRSFQNLKEHVLDPLSTAKLQFFITIAKVLTPFLKKFQSEEPMLPFMAEELYTILWTLLEKFIKKSVLEEATTAAKLSKIDVLIRKKIYYHQRKWMLALLAKFFYKRLKPRKRQAHCRCWSSKMSVLFCCRN